MALYREKHPEIIVELNYWDPATDKAESPVALEKNSEGAPIGRIYQVEHETVNLVPGWAYWRVVAVAGQEVIGASPYEAAPADQVELRFEAVHAEPDKHAKKLGKGEKPEKGYHE